MKFILSKFFVLSFLLTGSNLVYAKLSNVSIFYRCYGQISGDYAGNNKKLVDEVKAGRDPVDACMEVLNLAELRNSGDTASISNTKSFLSRSVLKTMHNLHYSWFANKGYPEVDWNGFRNYFNVFGSSSPALYITKSLFDKNYKYKNILMGDVTYIAKRTTVTTRAPHASPYQVKVNNKYVDDHYSIKDWVLKGIPFAMSGDLTGIKTLPKNHKLQYDKGLLDKGKSSGTASQTYNLHWGGGILGSTPYMVANSQPSSSYYRTDGGLKTYRKWSRSVFKDILCRSLPVVRELDAAGLADAKSSLPFRRSIGCTKCHMSMDPMSGLLRNLQFTRVGRERAKGHIFLINKYNSSAYKASDNHFPVNSDSQFYKKYPGGSFAFRTYDGKMVKKNHVQNVEELGNIISSQTDMYACLAKRYLKYFTGIDAQIGDASISNPDPDHKLLNSEERKMRNLAIKLGKELQNDKNQDPRTIIEKILRLPMYQEADYSLRGLK